MAYIVVDVAYGPLIRQESEVLGEANVAPNNDSVVAVRTHHFTFPTQARTDSP